jgi:anti-sigma factor RsiW
MNCDRARDLIQLYLDNELDACNTLQVQRHLEHCPACSRLLELYSAQDHALKQSARLESVDSHHVRERILAAIGSQSDRVRLQRLFRPAWRRVAAIAAIVIIAMFLLLWGTFLPGIDEKVYAAVVADHADHCSIEVMMGAITDTSELNKLCVEYAGVKSAPDLSAFGLGSPRGRICAVLDKKFLHLIYYDQEKHPLSVFARPHSINGIKEQPVLLRKGGYQVASVSRSGVDVLVVSSYDDEQTVAIAEAIAAHLLSARATAAAPQARVQLRGWRTNTEKRSVDLGELISGGPPKDGIPAIDFPHFQKVSDAHRWLKPNEPVISLVVRDEARAYPLQILIWHEIVNDRIAGLPLAVTFCPLCYSAVVFDRTVDGQEYKFGVSGMLRHSDMIMFDRETESLWQQLTGEAIVGDLTGARLRQLPAQIISFEQFSSAYPDGFVLSRETGYKRDYGRNPYVGYDNISQRPFLFRSNQDERLLPMEKVITVSIGRIDRAYPYSITRKLRVINDSVDGQPVVIFHNDGAVSALDAATISTSRDVGSTGVFDPRVDGLRLIFLYENGKFMDQQRGSLWDITGQALEGELKGRRLAPIAHGDYFAFAWFAFKPQL